MDERWVLIEGFTDYQVSESGLVMNRNTGRILRPTINQTGVVKIGLMQDGRQACKSVRLLVARAFVGGYSKINDTPLALDCDPQNNHYKNLVWRPRWFVWAYMKQFETPERRQTIHDSDGRMYPSLHQAAREHGILIVDLWDSISSGKKVYPINQVFTMGAPKPNRA